MFSKCRNILQYSVLELTIAIPKQWTQIDIQLYEALFFERKILLKINDITKEK